MMGGVHKVLSSVSSCLTMGSFFFKLVIFEAHVGYRFVFFTI